MRVLYISYDGALDPLGQSQVVPYLEGLSALGHTFSLLTFEKPTRWGREARRLAMEARLRAAGVRWHPLPYHKRPPVASTAWDLLGGLRASAAIIRRDRTELVHARSYPSSLIALRLRRKLGIPFLFDMRGLYAEERVDGGLWPPDGRVYRLVKRLEAAFLREAAGVITLTHASEPIVSSLMGQAGTGAPLAVIPTSVDLEHFRPVPPGTRPFTLAYVGSVGTWYLLDEMMQFGKAVLDLDGEARLLFLTNDGTGAVRQAAAAAGVVPERLTVKEVDYESVPAALHDVDATFAFIKPAPSKVASAATKFSESLSLGLPVAVNAGVGDSAELVASEGVGVVVDPSRPEDFPAMARRLREVARRPQVRSQCRAVAERHFDLAQAVANYAAIYREAMEYAGNTEGTGR